MRGIILAGGTGSRLMPLTRATNKHLLPVGDVPMIYHPIKKLRDAGILDIMVVTGTEHMGAVVQCLGSGADLGCEFSYKVQDTAGGIAQALGLCKSFCDGHKICVILGDNIFSDELGSHVVNFEKATEEIGAMLLLKGVKDLTRYGVAFSDQEGVVRQIVEKPSRDEMNSLGNVGLSKHAVTGIYFYDPTVFDKISSLKPSDRGELEITDVNNAYLEEKRLLSAEINGFWTDAGTPASLRRANELVRKAANDNLIQKKQPTKERSS